MTYEETALLAAIAADPTDDLPRLALADYIEENKEDGRERADAIRRGVKNPKWFTFGEGEVAHLAYAGVRSDLSRICNVVLARGYPGVTWQTYKGMIGACICTWQTWLTSGDNLLARNWIPEVVITVPPLLGVTGNGPNSMVAFVPGRDGRHNYKFGDRYVNIVLNCEWPTVAKWVVPEPIMGIRWVEETQEVDDGYYEQDELRQIVDPNSVPQVGATVKTIIGRSGTLITPVDARGYGCVRSKYL